MYTAIAFAAGVLGLLLAFAYERYVLAALIVIAFSVLGFWALAVG